MKYLLYGFACLLLCACKKNKTKINTDIYGRWKLTEKAFTYAGELKKYPADPNSPVYVEFRRNGDYYNPYEINAADKFTVAGNTVTLITGIALDMPGSATYRYKIEKGTLTLVAIEPLCPDSCHIKYISAN